MTMQFSPGSRGPPFRTNASTGNESPETGLTDKRRVDSRNENLCAVTKGMSIAALPKK